MLKADMAAYCGFECNICSQALIKDNPCQGCSEPDENKPELFVGNNLSDRQPAEKISLCMNNTKYKERLTASRSFCIFIY